MRPVEFKCALDRAKCRYIGQSANVILTSRVERFTSEEVVQYCTSTTCLPVLLYGIEVYSLSVSDLYSTNFARFLIKLFKMPNINLIQQVNVETTSAFRIPSESMDRQATLLYMPLLLKPTTVAGVK